VAGWPPEEAVAVVGSLPAAVMVGSRLKEAAFGSRPRGAAALGARSLAAVAVAGSLPGAVAVGSRLEAAVGSRPRGAAALGAWSQAGEMAAD
jgi:hypothetical protein